MSVPLLELRNIEHELRRDHTMIHGGATARRNALRLMNPSSRKTILALRIALFLTAVILFDLLLILWP